MGISVQRGFGLVEIVIALALGLAIILGVTTLFSNSSRSLDDVSRDARLTETAAYAMDLITADLQLAGFWAERATQISETTVRIDEATWIEQLNLDTIASGFVSGGALDQIPPCACLGTGAAATCKFVPAVGATAVVRSYNETPAVELVRGMLFPIFSGGGELLNTEAGAGTSNRCGVFNTTDTVTSAKTSEDYLAIRRASTCALGDTGCRSQETNVHYLQVQGDDTVENTDGSIVRRRGDLILSVDPDTAPDSTTAPKLATEAVSPAYRYISRIYFVDNADTLNRLYLTSPNASGQRYLKEALVQGVEALRFEWHVDTSGDGYADEVTTTVLQSDWAGIVGATVWMVVRSLEPEQGYTDNSTYTLPGPSFDPTTTFESHRRAVFSKTVEIVNIAGRRRS